MIDRVDLLIAVIGIAGSVVGSSTALWMALSKKADKEGLARLESRFATDLGGVRIDLTQGERRLEAEIARVESKLEAHLARVETKLDGLILRLVPEGRS